MKTISTLLLCLASFLTLCSCSTTNSSSMIPASDTRLADLTCRYNSCGQPRSNYESRVPSHIATHEKTIIVDPNVHTWAAYDPDGSLVKAGLATAGGKWCPDIHRPCKTSSGSFRISSLGGPDCKSTRYPLGKGGAPMAFCMFFHNNYSLHASSEVLEGNVSHGCVRLHYSDAQWIRYNFADVGTRVIVKPY